MFVIPALGGAERQVATIESSGTRAIRGNLDWTPDGQWIAFGGRPPGASTGLWLAPVEGGSSRRLTEADRFGLDPLRADVLARLGRFAEAEAVLRQDIRSFPGRARSYATLAVVLALEGRSRAEVNDTLEAMAKASPSPETVLLAAKTLDFLGDKSAARAWRRRAAAAK